MHEILCSRTGKAFKIDESGYHVDLAVNTGLACCRH